MAYTELAQASWWRFDRYEVRDGYVLPAEGAEGEPYDPWARHVEATNWMSEAGRSAAVPPHVSLLSLIQQRPVPGAEWHDAITPWCEEYGLLGALHQRVEMVRLHPRWERRGDQLHAIPKVYSNSALAWGETLGAVGRPRFLSGTGPQPGDLADPNLMRPSVVDHPPAGSEPLTVVRQLTGHEIITVADGWGRYFPDVPLFERETYAYPKPGTPDFWRMYAEPLDEFASLARMLVEGVEALLPDRAFAKGRSAGEHRSGGLGLTALIDLASSVSLAATVREDGSIVQRWASRSLIGALAMMTLQDLSGKGRPLRCECGKVFVSRRARARYCSDACRQRFKKRRQRARWKGEADG